MARSAESSGIPKRELSADSLAALQAYEWPGNVRQLRNLMDWLLGCLLIYSTLFGIGKVILHEYTTGAAFLAAGIAAAAVIYWDLTHRGWSAVME